MPPRLPLRCPIAPTVLLLGVVGIVGCDPVNPFPATVPNAVDTTTLYALRGTAIASPSAFDLVSGNTSRLDFGNPFDFAFDIDDANQPVIMPSSILGLSSDAGVLVSDASFESITTAPDEGFITDGPILIGQGTVFVARSRLSDQSCTLIGDLPRYGKFRVLAIDLVARTATLEKLVNVNCGFRDLEPGLPLS